jgi:hypothetical protein
MKIMYPARLSLETKCPNCNASITSIGGTLYACQKGHVIECVVLVTMNRPPKEDGVSDSKKANSEKSKLAIGPVTDSERLVS